VLLVSEPETILLEILREGSDHRNELARTAELSCELASGVGVGISVPESSDLVDVRLREDAVFLGWLVP